MLNQQGIDASLRALAEPTRRALVDRLSRGPATVSELARPFDMTFAAVVQHLQVLEAAGLIRSEKVGRVRTCRIEPAAFAPLADWIATCRGLAERRLDRLGALLAETDAENPTSPDHGKEKAK